MIDFDSITRIVILVAAVLVSLTVLQLILVPRMARRRGRDGAMWFMIVMVWGWFNAALAVVSFFSGKALAAGIARGDWSGLSLSIGSGALFMLFYTLPMWVLVIVGKWRPKYLPRQHQQPQPGAPRYPDEPMPTPRMPQRSPTSPGMQVQLPQRAGTTVRKTFGPPR